MKKLFLLFFLSLSTIIGFCDTNDKTILLAILARNTAHTLPAFLRCIDNLDYDKKHITVYINTNNNRDSTEELLNQWVEKTRPLYKEIVFDQHEISELSDTKPHEWTPQRFSILANIRQKSLEKTTEYACDYYFCVDCDNFIAPHTLKILMNQDKPIVAPLLRGLPRYKEPFCNYFGAVDGDGYYTNCPGYYQILDCEKVGTFQMPVVHQAYLIKAEYAKDLSYIDGSPDHEFIIFSRSARAHGVDQYICNEKEFGTFLHLPETYNLEEEALAFAQMQQNHRSGDLWDYSGYELLLGKINPTDKEYLGLAHLAGLLEGRNIKTVVSISSPPGGSSLLTAKLDPNIILAHQAGRNKGHYYYVSVHKPSLNSLAKKLVQFREQATFAHEDPLLFLNSFSNPIDCLYLNHPKNNSEKIYLDEIQAAYQKMSPQSMIIIEDLKFIRSDENRDRSEFETERTSKIAIDYLLEKGWQIVDCNNLTTKDSP